MKQRLDEATETVVAQLRDLVVEAKRGSMEAVSQIRVLLDRHPQLWKHYGDLAKHVEAKWLDMLSGNDASVRESVARTAQVEREELLSQGDSTMERMLVDRIIVSLLMVRFFDVGVAIAAGEPKTRVDFLQRQLDRANKRHLAAIKALAEVRKLLPSFNE